MYKFEDPAIKNLRRLERERGLRNNIASEEIVRNKIERFGDSLVIVDKKRSNEIVERYLEHLSLLPDKLIDTMKQKGLRVVLGAGDIQSVVNGFVILEKSFKNYHGSLEDYARKNNMKINGFYNANIKIAFANSQAQLNENDPVGESTTTSSVALHEYGHGVGHLVNVNEADAASDAHERFFSKLRQHARQSGPRDKTGIKELIADSFADYFTMAKDPALTYSNLAKFHKCASVLEYRFTKKYDKEWFCFMKEVVDSLSK